MLKQSQRRYRLIHPYVYIVYECSDWSVRKKDSIDGKIHGVYINRKEAEGKVYKLKQRAMESMGYLAILKKPIQGSDLLSNVLEGKSL